jgi:hypothetical protein
VVDTLRTVACRGVACVAQPSRERGRRVACQPSLAHECWRADLQGTAEVNGRSSALPVHLRGSALTLNAATVELRTVACRGVAAWHNLRVNVSEGWLATRSSLMNAGERRVVDLTGDSWNRLQEWLTRVGTLRVAMHRNIPAG